jgi:hypothetical protein
MTFLAMAQWQAWVLLTATAIAIVVIFFLRIQHRRVLISSSFLWERVLERRKRRSWMELLRRLISLLIALLIGLSLVMVFSEAELGDAGRTPRDIRLVVDIRPHMAAQMSDGSSRLQGARDRVAELLGGGSGADSFTVYDTNGRLIVARTRDRQAVSAVLVDLRAIGSRFLLPDPEPETETWVVTDGVGMPPLPPGYRVAPVYEPAVNVGVTAFEVRDWPSDAHRSEAFLEVGNFSSEPRETTIVLRESVGVQFRRTVGLQPGELYRNTFDLTPLEGGVLEAEVSTEGDAFDLDDSAYVFVAEQRAQRIAVVSQRPSSLSEILLELSHLELTAMTPAQYEEWTINLRAGGVGGMAQTAAQPLTFDGFIFEGYAPVEPPPTPALLFAPLEVSWLPRPQGAARDLAITATDSASAIMEFVDLHDVTVEQAIRVDPGSATAIAGDAGVPLILSGRSETAPWIMITFALRDSDFDQSLGFPIFVSNVLHWFRPHLATRAVELGDVVLTAAGVTVVDVLAEEPVAVRRSGERSYFTALRPGLFMATSAEGRVPISVGAGGRGTSAINRSGLDARDEDLEVPAMARRVWPMLLALAAALLALEALTYHRRITV